MVGRLHVDLMHWAKKVVLGCVRPNFQNAASSHLFGPSYLVVSKYVGFKVAIQMICLSAVLKGGNCAIAQSRFGGGAIVLFEEDRNPTRMDRQICDID